jgi:hypothetical protein
VSPSGEPPSSLKQDINLFSQAGPAALVAATEVIATTTSARQQPRGFPRFRGGGRSTSSNSQDEKAAARGRIIRLGGSVITRLGDSVITRRTGRLGDNPTGRLGGNSTGRATRCSFSLLVFARCNTPLFAIDTVHVRPGDAVVVLLGVPARPTFVDIHANTKGGLLGRPLAQRG